MFKAFLAAATMSLVLVATAQGAVITGVTIQDVSSQLTSGSFTRVAEHTVDGSGLNINGPGTHSTNPDATMWLNVGTGAFDGGNPDLDPTITFNLGSDDYVTTMRVWNYNEGGSLSLRGVDTALLEYSTDNVTYHSLGMITLNQAPGSDTVDFSQSVTLGVDAQYVRLTAMTDFPGADNGFVGLSEVQFNTVPEPSSVVALCGLGAMGLFVAARRRKSKAALRQSGGKLVPCQAQPSASGAPGSGPMFKTLLAAATMSLVLVATAQGAVITGVTIQDVSSQLTTNSFDRAAEHTVDGSGLNINGPGTHSNVPEHTMWLTVGTNPALDNGQPDTHPQITFNLGSVDYVTSLRVWNYNENSLNPAVYTLRGIDTTDIDISTDGVSYTPFLTDVMLTQAQGSDTVDFSQLISLGVDAQYIRLTNIMAFPGADNGLVGLSEVQFNTVPEPSSVVALCGLGVVGLVLAARRRKSKVA